MPIEHENGKQRLDLTDQEPTEDHARIRKELRKTREFGPSTRQQSRSSIQLSEQMDMLGQGFDATRIPLSKLYQMRRDPMISFALQFVKVPLVRAQWYVEAEDAKIAGFIDYALRKIYPRFVLQYLNCLDFGWQAIVKRFGLEKPDGFYKDEDGELQPIWDEGNVEAVTWRPFIGLPPQDVEAKWTKSGDFDGFIFQVEHEVMQGFPGQQVENSKFKVDVLHALWVTNERDSEHGSIYGYPRVGYAYRAWWTYWYNWALADRHFEKDADPPMIVRFPNSRVLDEETNEASDFRDLALSIGEQSRSGSTVAMPSEVHISEIDGRPTGIPLWDMKPVEGNIGNFDAFNKRFEYLDVAKIRAIMVPEQAFFEGRGGTSSRNVAAEMGTRFEESQAVLMAEIDDHLNRYVIPQLVVANFPEYEGSVRKITRGFGEEDIEFAKQIIQLIGQATPDKLPVDIREVLDAVGVPLLSPDAEQTQYDKWFKRMQDAAIPPFDGGGIIEGGSKPPKMDAKAGGPAGVSATGFYEQAPGKIHLAEDDAFLRSLPPSPHYEDAAILTHARALYGDWQDWYTEVYSDFAEFFAHEELNLADQRIKDFAANIVARWEFSLPGRLMTRTADILGRVMQRAGLRELKRAELTLEEWTPETEQVANWVRDRGAFLVTTVPETIREEIRTFLANEIEAGRSQEEITNLIREHFADFPDWKATRLARTEIKDAYNQAGLTALKEAGVKFVQASDASDGTDHETDDECQRRHGKIFPIDRALNVDEHPNGTLFWRALKVKNLSTEYVEVVDKWPTALAWYDSESETIYLRDDIDEQAERDYLLRLGEQLS